MLTIEQRKNFRENISAWEKMYTILREHRKNRKPVPDSILEYLKGVFSTEDMEQLYKATQTTFEGLDDKYDKILRDSAYDNFSIFCEYINRNEPPSRHHEYLIDLLHEVEMGKLKRLMVSMPPGHAKSTYCSHLFPAWYLGRNPNEKYMQAGHTQTFCNNRFGRVVRGIIDSDRFRLVFPGTRLDSKSRAADFFEFTNNSGYYLTRGVGTGISGYRANIEAVDDPFRSREDAESQIIRDKVWDWYNADFTTRMLPGAPQFIIATRWHPDDLCGRLEQATKEGKQKFEIINLPALCVDPDTDPLGREYGEPLWPEFYDKEYLHHLKRNLPPRDWNSLYMGNPVDEAGGVLKAADIHRYRTLPKDEYVGSSLRRKRVRRITASLDAATKATRRSDFTAITIWMEDMDNRHYMVHAARVRKEFNDWVRWAEELCMEYNVENLLVEDAGAGAQYIQIRKQSPNRNFNVVTIEVTNKSKEFRFDGITPMFAAKQVFLPESGTDWVADVESELLAFPTGRNDDYVDTVSQYLHWVRAKKASSLGVRKLHGY